MSKIILPDNHYLLRVTEDITTICKPLLTQYGLNMFVYGRYLNDGKCYLLTTHREWLSYHLSMGYTVPAPPPETLLVKDEAYHFIPSEGSFKQAKYDLASLFNSGQSVDLIYKHKTYYEVFCFSFLANNNEGINIFLNNLEAFKKFCLVFKEKASRLIKSAEQRKILLPDCMQGIPVKAIKANAPQNKTALHGYFIKKYHLNTHLGEIVFSKREIESIAYLLRGYTFKEIGKLLNLSPRTVETYLNNAQCKLGCRTKSEMINILLDLYPLMK